jgi:hypothetical protein
VRKTFAVRFSPALVLLSCALLCGCGEKPGDHQGNARAEGDPKAAAPAAGGATVGEAIADAEIRPVGDSGVHARAVLKEVGDLGVQVELDVRGLPVGKDPDAAYYAQVHEDSCSEERSGGEHEEHGYGAGPSLALVRSDRLLGTRPVLAEAFSGEQAHGGDEPGIPEEPPGSIEQPVSFRASDDGDAFVTSLLEGVAPERLRSGVPEYVHPHAVRPGGVPEELACGDLVRASRRGSG